jgi:hypothetical protein
MKKIDYVNNINSSNSNVVEEYVKRVYQYLKTNQVSLPFRLPNGLEPTDLDFAKVKQRFAEDGWNLTKEDLSEDYRSWSRYYIQ